MANKFINLDEAVMDWAWYQYGLNATRKQKKLLEKDKRNKQKYIGWHIDWRDVRVTDETTWSNLFDDNSDDQQNNTTTTTTTTTTVQPHNATTASLQGNTGPRASVLFETRFNNNTSGIQDYTIRTEKTTRSTMSTAVETGFTHGVEMSVKLASPCQVFEANAGYKREVSLCNMDGETFEEELTWGVESLIHVNANHVAEATLVVNEKRQAGNFVVVTRMRGTVIVTFTAQRDNNSQIKMVSNDIADVVTKYVAKERRKGVTGALDSVEVGNDGVVTFRTRGTCKFRYGVKQEIKLNQTELKPTAAKR